MNNFIFEGNKTNNIIVDGVNYRIDRHYFQPDYRVDLIENDGIIVGENTGNHSFSSIVDRTKSLDEQINEWANKMIELSSVCDICEEKHILIPLSDYDIEEFPQLKDKQICPSCRTKLYIDSMNQLQKELDKEDEAEDKKQKDKGCNFKYSIWVHPTRGDDLEIIIYTIDKLTDTDIKTEVNKLKKEYSAHMVEYPILTEL